MDESQSEHIEMKSRDSESKDIISSLPDELLGRILSFVPTKYAVVTSVLSSRWKDLYKLTTTTLDFDESPYLIERNGNLKKGRKKVTDVFSKFVNKTLAECKLNISKFRLKCELPRHNWIDVISASEIAEFDLSVLGSTISFVLQLHKLKCENLVVLKLDGAMVVQVRKSVTLPVLKVLFFKGIRLHDASGKLSSDNQGLSEILKGCPLLKELVIEGCDWNGGEFSDLEFANPLLRSLTFHSGVGGPLDQLNRCTIHMDLPSLVHLDYSECLAEDYVIRNLNSIREAKIDVHFNTDLFDDDELSETILGLIEGVCCCQSLQLSSQCLEALTRWKFELPTFCNLTQLHLTIGFEVTWNDVLWDFLHSSPCLKSLTLEQENEVLVRCKWIQPNKVVPCVQSHLKFINIIGFNGFKEEMQMILYFFKNAKVLEEMVIHWDNKGRAEKEEEVLQLPKSSKSCVIAFK